MTSPHFDLVIAGARIVTASDDYVADIGVRDGRIAAIAETLAGGARRIEAAGLLALPGGIEAHCHIAQESSGGLMTADDYRTGSISAAFGGNTTIIPFAAQARGQSIAEVIAVYDARAEPASVLDYSYHLIVSDPDVAGFEQEIAAAFARGVTSFKIFLTYDRIKLEDEQVLKVMAAAKAQGALTMVHAENNALVKHMVARLAAQGLDAPRYHAPSRPEAAEEEAIARVVLFAEFLDAPLLVVHVSTVAGMARIAEARLRGAPIFAETCPQYLFLTRDDLDRPGLEGAKFVCSPPLRDARTQDALWRGLASGVFDLCSSDHAPYRFDASGKLAAGLTPPFPRIANGMPGIGLRLPLLFSEGVLAGRITLQQFVALTSANAARIYGLAGRKGAITVGADADIALWDPGLEWVVRADEMHDAMDYTPFEGLRLTGKPRIVLQRGRSVVEDGRLLAEPGAGRFLARARQPQRPRRSPTPPELDPATNFGARLP